MRPRTFLQAAAYAGAAALLIAFAWHSATHAIDFPVYHEAATRILQGDYELYPAALYDDAMQAPVPGHGFRYAPAVAFLFVPFALLPLEIAAFLFFWVKAAAFVATFAIITRRLQLDGVRTRLVVVSVLVTGGYLVEEFRNGNLHLLVVFLMVLAFDLAARGRAWLPGAALALAISAKLLPALLLAYFLMRRWYAASAATAVALVLIWLLPAAFVGLEANNRQMGAFARFAVQKVDEQGNHSLRGAMFRHLTHNAADDPRNPDPDIADLPRPVVSGIALGASLAGAAVLAAALWRTPRNEEGWLLEMALLTTAIVVGSPHTQRIYYSSVVVPAAVLLAMLWRHPRLPGGGVARASLALIAAVGTYLPLVLATRSAAVAFEASSPHVIAALVLGGVLLRLTLWSKREPAHLSGPGAREASRVAVEHSAP